MESTVIDLQEKNINEKRGTAANKTLLVYFFYYTFATVKHRIMKIALEMSSNYSFA
jgi:hypothetical protein